MDFTDCTDTVGAADVPSRRPPRSGGGPGDRGPSLPIAAVSGPDLAACARAMAALSAAVQGADPARYQQALSASRLEAQQGPFRVAIVAEHPAQLRQKQELLSAVLAAGHELDGLGASGIFAGRIQPADRVAALFPGIGAHDPEMLRGDAAALPVLRETLDEVRAAYQELTSPPSSDEGLGAHAVLEDDVPCAVFAADLAVFRWLQRYGLRIDAVMGQDVGELAALVAAGVLGLKDGLRAARESGRVLGAAGAGASGRMLALACGVDRAQELLQELPGHAAVASDSSPASCTVSGDEVAIAELLTRAARADVAARLLSDPLPLHSRLLASTQPAFARALEVVHFRRPKLALVSTVSGTWADRQPLFRVREQVSGIWCQPVRLRHAIMALYTSRVRTFVECGPGRQLSACVDAVAAGHRHVAQPALHQGVGEVEQLHRTLACLFVVGACRLQPAAPEPRSHRRASSVTWGERLRSVDEDAEVVAILESLRSLIELVLPEGADRDHPGIRAGSDGAARLHGEPRQAALELLLHGAEVQLLADLARQGPGSRGDRAGSASGPRGPARSEREVEVRPGDPEP